MKILQEILDQFLSEHDLVSVWSLIISLYGEISYKIVLKLGLYTSPIMLKLKVPKIDYVRAEPELSVNRKPNWKKANDADKTKYSQDLHDKLSDLP